MKHFTVSEATHLNHQLHSQAIGLPRSRLEILDRRSGRQHAAQLTALLHHPADTIRPGHEQPEY
jgi:hypothetical protein